MNLARSVRVADRFRIGAPTGGRRPRSRTGHRAGRSQQRVTPNRASDQTHPFGVTMPTTVPSPAQLAEQLAGFDAERLRQLVAHLTEHARAVRAGEVDDVDPNDVEHLERLRDAAELLVDLAQ